MLAFAIGDACPLFSKGKDYDEVRLFASPLTVNHEARPPD
jgi:hypothetical protein